MPIIHYNNDILLFASRRNAICSNKQDNHISSWLTGEVVLHDISTLVTLNQEVTRDGRTRKTTSDGQRWREAKTRQRIWYVRNDRGQKAVDDNGGVQGASCDNRVWLPFMLRQSMIRVYWGWGESLQVDELVHQQQGARQAGQAGFRAATVTTRVASWNWPGETGGRGGRDETGRQTEGERGQNSRKGSHNKQGQQWGKGRVRQRERNREKNLPIS